MFKRFTAAALAAVLLFSTTALASMPESAGEADTNDLGASVSAEQLRSYGDSITALGFKYTAVTGNKKNAAYSPYGLSAAISMLAGGIQKKSSSQKQILKAAGAKSVSDLNKKNLAFIKQADYGTENIFKSSNLLLIDKSVSGADGIKPAYSKLVKKYYGAEVRTADFMNDLEGEKEKIRQFVDENTNGFLNNYDSSATAETAVDLMNVTYFKGKWMYPFSKEDTKKRLFKNRNGKAKKVPTMQKEFKEKINYYEDDCFRAVMVPYSVKRESYEKPVSHSYMYIILPKKKSSLDCVRSWNKKSVKYKQAFLKNLETAGTFNTVSLRLPRFELDETYDLFPVLKKAGITDVLGADPKITEIVSQPLEISSATQRTKIKVDEEGTEAAAVTEFDMKATAVMDPKTPPHYDFFCNVPFVFMIRDQSGMTLFAGAVNKL